MEERDALYLPRNTLAVLKKHDLHFVKKFGQNFLIDGHILESIVEASGATKDDCVLEIGPGIGTLTRALSRAAGRVVAVELDKKLLPVLADTLADCENVTVLQGDILKTDVRALVEAYNGGKPIRVVANLPYYITTPILMTLLEKRLPLYNLTVMVQKEVADRMQASPGGKSYGALSLATQYYAVPRVVAAVPRECFMPAPNVDSAVVSLTLREEKPVTVVSEDALFRCIRAAFGQRRKTLVNALSHAEAALTKERIQSALSRMGLDEKIRGEALTLSQFAALSDLLVSATP